MTKICSRCETDNTDAAKVCKLCGTPFALPQGGAGLVRGAAPGPAVSSPTPPPAALPDPFDDSDATVMIPRGATRVPIAPPMPPAAPAAGPLDFPDFSAPPPPAFGATPAAAAGGSLLDLLSQPEPAYAAPASYTPAPPPPTSRYLLTNHLSRILRDPKYCQRQFSVLF
jgi:hypothetical protein